jgi:hypothetical protein
MRNIAVIFKDHQEAVKVHRFLRSDAPLGSC